MEPYFYGMHGFGMHGLGMGLGWLIFLGLIVGALYFLKGEKHQERSAKDILDLRYAKGEIDTKEYRERLKELGYLKDDSSNQTTKE